MQVIVYRTLDRRIGIFPDIQSKDAFLVLIKPRCLHISDEGIDAAVIETHAIDDGAGLRQAEHAGHRIARLRARRHGAHFNKSEAERCQAIDVCAILIQPGGQADRIGEGDAHYRARIIRGLGDRARSSPSGLR